METTVADFLPKYPSIDIHEFHPLLDPYDGEFYASIFLKKEFYQERLEPNEAIPDEPGTQFKHQRIISRFLSSHTLYDELVVVHEPGTGKTCTAVGAIEQIRREGNSKRGALIFTTGPDQISNFEQELVYKCTAGQYIPEEDDLLKATTVKRRVTKLVGEFYQFNTYQTFAKRILEMSDVQIRDDYSDRIIVIDEVHHLRQETTDPKVYQAFWHFLHTVKRCKIIIMSGTPMKDGVEEASSVMNLVLPLDKQLPTGKEFINRFFTPEPSGVIPLSPKTTDKDYSILRVKPEQIPVLKDAFKGRVSYLRAMQSQAKPVFVGNRVGALRHFNIVPCQMSEFQSKWYAEAYKKDMETRIVDGKKMRVGVFTTTSEASLFVYPDGSCGSAGFQKYMKETKKDRYTLGPELDGELSQKGLSTEDKLQIVHKYSCKYAETIRQLIEARKQGKSSFVYCSIVKGSGAILFASLLRKFGFTRAFGGEEIGDEQPRYALFTGTGKGSVTQVKALLARFNSPDNVHGQVISVVIGSRVASEGFSLLNVQTETVLTPFWNYSETVQALARGLRAGSHRMLLEEQESVEVDIYQRVAIPSNKVPSLDMQMYQISEIKDINIKGVERIMRESAFDCALTYKRNYRPTGTPRDCDYTDCNYTCDNVPMDLITNVDPPIDYSTYQLYYDDNDLRKLQKLVQSTFSTNFSISLTVASELDIATPPFILLSLLNKLISTDTPIKDKYGFYTYLREEDNTYFLVDSISASSKSSSVYYAKTPIVTVPTTFGRILEKLQKTSVSRIKRLSSITDPTEFATIVGKLPKTIQEEILEASILAKQLNTPTNIRLRELALSYYRKYYKEINSTTISSFLQQSNNGLLRCLPRKSNMWSNCSPNIISEYNRQSQNTIENLEKNPYGYYGLYRVGPDGQEFFCIKQTEQPVAEGEETDKRKKPKGLSCQSWSVPNLLSLVIDTLKINPPDTFDIGDIDVETVLRKSKYKLPDDGLDEESTRRAIYWVKQTRPLMCTTIRDWFAANDMLVEDQRCASH